MNKTLEQQIKHEGLMIDSLPESFIRLLEKVSHTYDTHEQNQELMLQSIELNEGILFSVDMRNYKLKYISKNCESIYGYTAEEFYDDSDLWNRVVHPGDQHIIQNQFEQMLSGLQIKNEYRVIHKDGTLRWLQHSLIPTLDIEGNLVRLDGVTRDNTMRHMHEPNHGSISSTDFSRTSPMAMPPLNALNSR